MNPLTFLRNFLPLNRGSRWGSSLTHNKWAAVAFTLAATVASLWLILAQTNADSNALSHGFGTLLYGFCMAGIALTAAALLPQSVRRETKAVAYLLAIILPLLDAIWFYFNGWEYLHSVRDESIFLSHILPWLCMFLVIPTLPFMRQDNDRHMQVFGARWALLTVLASWVVGAVCGLMEGLLAGTFALFSFEIDWLYGIVGIWGVWLGAIATLGVMPDMEQPGEAQWTIKLGRRVFLPVLLIYLLVLLVYLLKIIFQWQLPDGTVTYMVSAMMIQLVAVWILIYPSLHLPELKWEKLMRYLPLICLPLVVLMSIGLYRRISDYGITIGRVYAVALNVWFYLLIIVLAWRTRHGKPLTIVLSTLACGLVLLTSIPYINARDYTHRRIVRELDLLMSDSITGERMHFEMYRDLDNWLQTLPEEQGQAMASKWNYLTDAFGDDDLSRWVIDTASVNDRPWGRYHYYNLTYRGCPDTLQQQLLLDYSNGAWANHMIPEGTWSCISLYVRPIETEIRENPDNPAELIMPIRYRDFTNNDCTDTILINLRDSITSNALFVPTYMGNIVSFRDLKITRTNHTSPSSPHKQGESVGVSYSTSEEAILFIK